MRGLADIMPLDRRALAALYRELALRQVPRILGLGDRQATSETHGCFDRAYWHYRSSDFPNAQQQQVSLLLAELCGTGSSYGDKAAVRGWCIASIDFWARIQHRDGSLDEAYPNERGYCATALTTAAVGQAVRALRLEPPREALARAGRWLASRRDPPVSNQVAGAALALLACSSLLDDRKLEAAGLGKVRSVLGAQDREGFFPEYGGADVGYQTLTLSFLGRIERGWSPPGLLASIHRGAAAVTGRLDARGRHETALNSRRTQFVYPCGLVVAGEWAALERHRAGLEAGLVLEPGWLDDRYVIWLATDYLLAARALEASETPGAGT